MTRIFLGILLFGFSINLSGQIILKESIDSLINTYYPSSNLNINTLYIIDGIPIEENKIDSLILRDNIEIVKYIYLDQLTNITWDKKVNAVILVSKLSWTNKERRSDYKTVCKIYKKNRDDFEKKPVLLINSKTVDIKDSYEILKEISLNNINSINIFKDSVSTEFFGINSKNGLIEIKTKK